MCVGLAYTTPGELRYMSKWPVQLGIVFCIHVVFLGDEIVHKQMGNLQYVQIVPLCQLHWNKFIFSKQAL